jgi:hypothetical protein
MTPINYDPTFQHTDWVDNVDRVQASAFNDRFHGLEAEFTTLRSVITQISDALTALGQAPPPRPVKVTLVPALTAVGGDAWDHVFGGAAKPVGKSAAVGMMTLQLPQGSRIQSLRVIGRKDSGNLTITVRRQGLSATATPEPIFGTTPSTGPFDVTANAPSIEIAKIDNEQFRYYVTAELDSAGTATGVSVQINAFQITYMTS